MKNEILTEKLAALPDSPGVYIMKHHNGVIYVGKAVSLKNRVRQYFQSSRNHTSKVLAMVDKIDDFDTILCDTELEALVLENNLIKKYKPYYNIRLKDDKAYPYIRIDLHEPFPVVRLVRRVERDDAKYFGPYFGATMVREVINVLCQTLPLRTCSRNMERHYDRPCVRYEIGLCKAPCVGRCTKEEYAEIIKNVLAFLNHDTSAVVNDLKRRMQESASQMRFEQAAIYRDRIRSIEELSEKQKAFSVGLDDRDVIAAASCAEDMLVQAMFVRSGWLIGTEPYHIENALGLDAGEVISSFILSHYDDGAFIPKEILLAEPCQDMEALSELLSEVRGSKVDLRVPQRGAKRELALMAQKNAQEGVNRLHERLSRAYERTKGAAAELGRALGIPAPRRIECYDISNFQGSQTVASMVVFINGEAAKKEYRHFKIKTVEGPNDFESMKEVLTRRFTHLKNADAGFDDAPDLVIVDGGKGQLSSAVEALEKLDLEKMPALFGLAKQFEELYRPGQSEPIVLERTSDALHLLQRIRDEAHRFAITHHRKLRGKHTLHSVLDDIPGIGPARRRALLSQYKSIPAIVRASVEELEKIKGMNASAAQNVYRFFRKSLEQNLEHPD